MFDLVDTVDNADIEEGTIISRVTELGVTVSRRHLNRKCHNADYNDYALRTLQSLLDQLGPVTDELRQSIDPQLPASMAAAALGVMCCQGALGTFFVNPLFIVTAETASAEFYRKVRICRLEWIRWLESFLRRSRVRRQRRVDDVDFQMLPKEMRKAARVMIRELRFTGVLVVNGKHRPRETPDRRTNETDLIGTVFGRLTARRLLSRGRCFCECSCGRGRVVRISHLLNGHTKSCGCLRAEIDEAIQKRKNRRALLQTGPSALMERAEKLRKRKEKADADEKRRQRQEGRTLRKASLSVRNDKTEACNQPQLRSGQQESVLLPSQRAPESDSTGGVCRSEGAPPAPPPPTQSAPNSEPETCTETYQEKQIQGDAFHQSSDMNIQNSELIRAESYQSTDQNLEPE